MPAALAGGCRAREGVAGALGGQLPASSPPAPHSWPLALFSVTLGPDRLALDTCGSKASVEALLLSPGGPKASGSGALALARLARPPSLSSAIWPIPLATRPQGRVCWAQGFDPDLGKDRSRYLGWVRETARVELGPCMGTREGALAPATPSRGTGPSLGPSLGLLSPISVGLSLRQRESHRGWSCMRRGWGPGEAQRGLFWGQAAEGLPHAATCRPPRPTPKAGEHPPEAAAHQHLQRHLPPPARLSGPAGPPAQGLPVRDRPHRPSPAGGEDSSRDLRRAPTHPADPPKATRPGHLSLSLGLPPLPDPPPGEAPPSVSVRG